MVQYLCEYVLLNIAIHLIRDVNKRNLVNNGITSILTSLVSAYHNILSSRYWITLLAFIQPPLKIFIKSLISECSSHISSQCDTKGLPHVVPSTTRSRINPQRVLGKNAVHTRIVPQDRQSSILTIRPMHHFSVTNSKSHRLNKLGGCNAKQ